MPSVAILGLLSVGIGIELAVTAFLILRFLESREPQVRWWAVAFALYTAHVLLEPLAFIWPAGLFLLWWRHLFFLLAAAAMARSFGPLPLPLSPLLAAVALVFSGLVLSGLLFSGSPGWAALPPSVLAGLFTIAFALGVLLRSWARARDLATVNAVAETLNRSTNIQEAVESSLHRVIELMGLRSGWVFINEGGGYVLQEDGGYVLAARHALPDDLAANDAAAMTGDCRCLQLLREGRLLQAVNTVSCLRLENAGWPQTRHASVPLHTAEGALGVMNLVLPPGRNLAGRELDMLAAVGHQIALAVERNRLFEEVRAKEAARGELIEKLLTAQEDERRRIARELHDEAGQALTALILNLEMAEQAAAPEEAACSAISR